MGFKGFLIFPLSEIGSSVKEQITDERMLGGYSPAFDVSRGPIAVYDTGASDYPGSFILSLPKLPSNTNISLIG